MFIQDKPKMLCLSCLPFQSLQNKDFKMDIENFSRSDIKRHLAELGYSNITEEKLDGFVSKIYFLRIWVFCLYKCFYFSSCVYGDYCTITFTGTCES